MELTQRGATLMELMVTLVILAALLVTLAPLTGQWLGRGQQRASRCALVNAIDMTRGLALRNLPAATDTPPAVLCLSPTALNVYRGDRLPSACPSSPDARAVWSTAATAASPFFTPANGAVVPSATACYALDSAGTPADATIGATSCDPRLESRLIKDALYANCRFK
ncbi:hypothetical protein GCM10011289_21430 [Paludibacterium paludis]|uniref:Prepilin-type N-terminal cleavage/methylation domain-containing protein n=2 Tax=Paludibacterium paludis TaxID=1225769 RepID=A0A918P3Z3_9NEIS|nr:hypothetical protein GCM10011289_21430 [Paludibacterium paludis]